ncbi:hypothetical protein AGR56_15740 [Clostridium sp. DMHC 10]|uniref:hypothetical protein n=1 Tax=Clostridium sp. DMHC 10 TaxID=747377 RepID=UPI00069F567F|nr:hypothetical protein [Clostridium sp. DMHC 10]KOF57715.1 hypothetical protein AGR56_15740 [Clostridium sp. DMHC 10]
MIEKYLISTCLFIIDEFNTRLQEKTIEEKRDMANEEFSEADLVVRLGYPFKNMANFNMQGKGHDIVVKQKGFKIEVKYLRNFNSYSQSSKARNKTYKSNKTIWYDAFQKDFDWLCKEIKGGQKGNVAFVIGWFNVVDSFSKILQLGQGKGCCPKINTERCNLFPFIKYNIKTMLTKDIEYRYYRNLKEYTVDIADIDDDINCMFIGNKNDVFHFAIYY